MKHYRAEIALLHADPDYLRAEDRALAANRKLDALKVAVLNRGRERSRDEYNDLIHREDRARNLRHPIRWAKSKFSRWRRRRRSAQSLGK